MTFIACAPSHRLLARVLIGGVALAASSGAARAQAVRPDPDNIFTVQVENDAVSTLKGTSDQYYTSGIRLGWTSGADAIFPVAQLGPGHLG